MTWTTLAATDQLWSDFLQRWPLESLPELTLEQYTRSGDNDTFTYWLEVITEGLGSIWGGSAFKFGIFSRKDKSPKESDQHVCYAADYAWARKYGDSPEEAFAQVKSIILAVAQAARRGDLAAVDGAGLGTVTKWKLAFLYQDRNAPTVLPLYLEDSLRLASGMAKPATPGQMHAALMANRGDQPLLDYGRQVWEHSTQLAAQRWSGQRLQELLEASEDLVPVKPATAKMAGFQTHDGRQLALDPGRKPALFLEPGEWLAAVESFLPAPEFYPAERTRHSGLEANAPRLWQGHPAVLVTLPTEDAFHALLELYVGTEIAPAPLPPADGPAMNHAPLNQILFGPPGTGKTYETINAALEILDPVYLADNTHDRPALKTRFDKLAAEGRIRFVTFHQSFSYEDFVEGLRAESDAASGQLRYEVVDGVFKSLCELASAKITQRAEAPVDIGQRRVWKMSLGNTLGSDASIFEECLKGNYVLLGYGAHIDFSGCASRSEVQQRFADGGVQLDGPNDYSLTSVVAFVTKMKPGDLVVVSDGNFKFRAIGEITGDYAFKPHSEYEADYAQMRPVKWLRQYAPSLPHTELLEGQFSQMTLYELRSPTLNREKLQALLGAPVESADGLFAVGQRFGQGYVVRSVGPDVAEFDKPKGGVLPLPLSLVRQLLAYVRSGQLEVEDIRKGRVFEKVAEAELEKYIVNGYQHLFAALVEQLMQPKLATTPDARVLIIDEINRGNVSRIFGELITLIEESKRAGNPEALEVILPYSKKPFSVPNNLYLIGTMNTADRSLAGLDLALRRRFTFREMPPKPELLHGVMVEGVDIGQLLAEMNARIEVLLDRDHRIGHAYFMALKDDEDKRTLAHLAAIFRQKILPLLQEYFFEDWERIQWVLNDHRKAREDRFVLSKGNVSQALFGPGVQLPTRAAAWYLKEAAFDRVQAYRGIVSAQAPALSAEAHLQAATAQVVSEFVVPADEQSA